MMWDYTEDVDRLLSPYLWPMYTQVFPNIWVASAYKGAFGETLHKVDIQRHALNQLSWVNPSWIFHCACGRVLVLVK